MVFCAVLRWEPFVSRYMLSYLALLCPMIAIQLQNRLPRILWYGMTAALVLLCLTDLSHQGAYHQTMLTKWGADQRPLGYFSNRYTEYAPYCAICDAVDAGGYKLVGLFTGADDYEYPLWYMLSGKVRRMEHIAVSNESRIYADSAFQPDCIIWLGSKPAMPYEWNGKTYETCIEGGEGRYLLCP